MKKLIVIALLAANFSGYSQTKIWCLQPSCKQTIPAGDSTLIFAQLNASDGYANIIWQFTSGPVAVPVTYEIDSSYTNTQQMQRGFIGVFPVPGTYLFTATGLSKTGISGSVTDTVVVIPVPKFIAYITITYSDSSKLVQH